MVFTKPITSVQSLHDDILRRNTAGGAKPAMIARSKYGIRSLPPPSLCEHIYIEVVHRENVISNEHVPPKLKTHFSRATAPNDDVMSRYIYPRREALM